MIGVRPLTRSKSSMSRGTSASAGEGEEVEDGVVEPPVAATAAIGVLERLAGEYVERLEPRPEEVHHQLAGPDATSSLRDRLRGGRRSPSGERPRKVSAERHVLAVYWPPHAPAPGHA
jgi:hypothetical protein